MPLEAMIDKAMRLVKAGRVERIDERRFNVIGDHGTYFVVRTPDGKISCSCPGFQSRGQCSHSAAVMIMTEIPKRP
jgi:uncharacterized Zn finger protein